jgi:hypothetical protein
MLRYVRLDEGGVPTLPAALRHLAAVRQFDYLFAFGVGLRRRLSLRRMFGVGCCHGGGMQRLSRSRATTKANEHANVFYYLK